MSAADRWTVREALWFAFCVAVPVVIAHAAFITATGVLGHDNVYWIYPIYHFFVDTLHAGHFPYWNPYLHGGEPFAPLLLHARLLDPVSYVVFAIGHLLTDDIVLLFNWDRFARAVLAAFGGYLLLRGVATHTVVRACLPPLLLWSSLTLTVFQQPGVIDMFLYAPFAAHYLLRLLHEGDTRWPTWLGFGVAVGLSCQSVFYVGVWLLVLFMLAGFALFDRAPLVRLARAPGTPVKALAVLAFIVVTALPNAIMLLDQPRFVFPARMLDHAWVGQVPRGAPGLHSPGPGASEFSSFLLPYGVIHYTGSFVAPASFVEMLAPDAQEPVRTPALARPHRGAVDGFMYVGLLGVAGAIVGFVAGAHPLKRVWLVVTIGFGLLLLGPSGGLHWALQFAPPVRAVRHTVNLTSFFLLGLVFFFVLGANRVVARATRDGVEPPPRTTALDAWRWVHWLTAVGVVAAIAGALGRWYVERAGEPRPLPVWPTEALILAAIAAVLAVSWRVLGASSVTAVLLIVSIGGALGHTIASNHDVLSALARLLAALVLPALVLARVPRLIPAQRTRLLAVVALILMTDLALYFHQSASLWSWARPDQLPWQSGRLGQAPGHPERVPTMPVTLLPYVQAVRYLPLTARQTVAFDGVLLPIGAREGYFGANRLTIVAPNMTAWSGERDPGVESRLSMELPDSVRNLWLWATVWVKSDSTVPRAVVLEITQNQRVSMESYRQVRYWQPLIAGMPLSSGPIHVIGRVSDRAGAPASFNGLTLRLGPLDVTDPRRFDVGLVRSMPRWNTLAMPRRYHETIHGPLPAATMTEVFAIGKPRVQFRAAARPERELAGLARLEASAAAEVLRTTVFIDGEPRTTAPPAAGADARVATATPDVNTFDVTVDAPHDGYLYVADGYDPRWRATLDAQPAAVVRANGAFKAVAVPAGRHRVRLEYRPPALRAALWAYFGLAAIGVIAVVVGDSPFFRRRAAGSA